MKKEVTQLRYYGSMSVNRIYAFVNRKSAIVLLIGFALALTGCKKDNIGSGNGYGTYSQSSGTVIQNGQTFFTSTADLSAVKVTGGTYNLTLSIVATGGNSSSVENSNFYGLNAVMLAYGENEVAVINTEDNLISSTGIGANCIFAYGKAIINTERDKLSTTGESSHGIMSTGGAIIKVTKDTVTTSGANSSVIWGGSLTVLGGAYTSNGANSPAVYSNGSIRCDTATFTAKGAEALVVEGSNSIELVKCTVKCTFDKWGSLVFQNTSGNPSVVGGHLTMTGGSFTYTGKKGGMFYNTNSTAYYILKGVTLSNSCDTLIRCIKGSWGGSSAANGGNAIFVADAQTMSGLIHVDASSKANISLKNYSVFTGAINNSNTANLVSLTMDYSSNWTLTATSHINGLLSNPMITGSSVKNITGNGFNIYYKSLSNPSLGGLTYSLADGGQLIPE